MNGNQSQGSCELILTTDGQCITLILSSADGKENDGVTLYRDVWNAIVPIALSEDPVRLAEFVSQGVEPDGADAMGVTVDGHLLSLFWLAVIVGCCGFCPAVMRIADCWMRIPLSERVGWWHEASSDKPLHAQILATGFPASPVFERKVPAWLPRLIEAGTSDSSLVRADTGLHWTYAVSPLGTSCIAFLDDESGNQDACLTFSDCRVSCGAADGSLPGVAVEAIDQLIAFRDMVEADSAVARRVGWDASSHELIAMAATLQEWRNRLLGPDPRLDAVAGEEQRAVPRMRSFQSVGGFVAGGLGNDPRPENAEISNESTQ
jgi:hypothetical protein